MALRDLSTHLKSVKFGKDMPDGGSSNQPYVTKDINKKSESAKLGKNGGKDLFLRGGSLALTRSVEDVTRIQKYFSDFKSFNGPGFIIKQNLLSKSGVDVRAGSPKFMSTQLTFNQGIYTPLGTITQAGVNAFGGHLNKNGLNPANGILGQLTEWAAGKLGVDSAKFDPVSLPKYAEIYNNKGVKDIKDDKSRLLNISKKHNYVTIEVSKDLESNINKKGITQNLSKLNTSKYILNSITSLSQGYNPTALSGALKKIINPDDNVILSYSGGPDSILGVGTTNIHFASFDRSNQLKLDKETWTPKNDKTFYGILNPLSLNYIKGVDDEALYYSRTLNKYSVGKDIEKTSYTNLTKDGKINDIAETFIQHDKASQFGPSSYLNKTDINSEYKVSHESLHTPKIEDFRHVTDNKREPWNGVLEMYGDTGNHKRIFLNDPTHRRKSNPASKSLKYDFTNTDYIVDEINASSQFSERNKFDDLIKFRIGVWDRISGGWQYIQFRAYVENFSDNYTADWDQVAFMGRGEKFQKYKGFNREISLDFTVAALSSPELIPMYKKLNYLASTMAPNYGENGYMSGTIINLTVGGYIYEIPGTLGGMSLSVPQESPWEIGVGFKGKYDDNRGDYKQRDGSWDHSVKELPMIMKVSGFKFTPIHDFVPQYQREYENGSVRFISLNKGDHNNYDNK